MTPDATSVSNRPGAAQAANPATAAALANLRDIHLPDPVALWPLAPGWWLLALVLVALAIGIALRLRARRRSPERHALRLLDSLAERFAQDGDRAALASGLSRLLRRIALVRAERHAVAALHGPARAEALAGPTRDDRAPFDLVAQLESWIYAGRDPSPGAADPAHWIAAARALIRNRIRTPRRADGRRPA
jgi:hypothetical protein